MWKVGWGEGLLILAILLLLFGANKLPAIGKGLGEGIKNFKNSFKSGAEGEDNEGQGNVKKKNS